MTESTTSPPGSAVTADPGQAPPIPIRHPGRAVAAILAIIALGGLLWSLAHNPNLRWDVIGKYLTTSLVFKGLETTIWLTVAAMVIGVLGGIGLAVMRLSANPVLSSVASLFVWMFRGTPLLVQILFWGFAGAFYKKLMIGVPFTHITFWSASTNDILPATTAALLALGLNEAAYSSEIVRAGILSVDPGQTEAAHSLGMSPALTMRRIVLPQAMRVIIPPMGNETINMLKSTALVSVIGAHELMSQVQDVYAQNYQVIPLLMVASIWYLALTSLLSIPQRYLERRYGRGTAGAPSISPLRRLLQGVR